MVGKNQVHSRVAPEEDGGAVVLRHPTWGTRGSRGFYKEGVEEQKGKGVCYPGRVSSYLFFSLTSQQASTSLG